MRFLKPEEYQPQVERLYEEIKAKLQRVLPFAEVEHVGSSAIRGAISKGDLDILVRVSREQMEPAIEAVKSLGFTEKQDTLRTESLCMLEGGQETAIQVIERGSQFEFFCAFRDRLNADPRLVEQYNAMKLSATGLSAEEYRAIKSKFIESILAFKK